MELESINWDDIPDVIDKEQFYKICHISKSTARYLLQSGKVPCKCSGKRTRCYKIKKQDVIAYLENRKVFPESYSAPAGWYAKGSYPTRMSGKVPPVILEDMHEYYIELLKDYSDVVTTSEISLLTGYGNTSVNRWCSKGYLKSFKKYNMNMIPKAYLVEFFCSQYFRAITRKSEWHIRMLKAFPHWKQLRDVKKK